MVIRMVLVVAAALSLSGCFLIFPVPLGFDREQSAPAEAPTP